MAAATKCPVCGKAVAVGLVSGTVVQHDDKNGQLCEGSGQQPVAAKTPAARTPAGARSSSGTARKSAASPATRGGLTVRRVEVDPDQAREREERAAKLREERAAAARERNEVHVSYFDEPGSK
jgi:hypothetical protein